MYMHNSRYWKDNANWEFALFKSVIIFQYTFCPFILNLNLYNELIFFAHAPRKSCFYRYDVKQEHYHIEKSNNFILQNLCIDVTSESCRPIKTGREP